MNSSLLAQIEILTHPNTSSKSQTNTITTISRLPNLHILQNCIQLLLAIDKMNSRVRKKSLNHCGPSGLSDSDTTFHAAERSCQETRPLSNRPLSLEFLCSFPLEGWPCHYPGKVSSCVALPPLFLPHCATASQGQAFSSVTPQIPKLTRMCIIYSVSHSDD